MVPDQQTPPRLKLSEGEWVWRMMKAEGLALPKRDLLSSFTTDGGSWATHIP